MPSSLDEDQGLDFEEDDDAPLLEAPPEDDEGLLLEESPEDDGAQLMASPEDDDGEFLDIGLDSDAVSSPLERESAADDEKLIDASLDAAESLFDDGDDAPELTEVETSLLDGTSPDTSLFESSGTDLSTANRGSPKKA